MGGIRGKITLAAGRRWAIWLRRFAACRRLVTPVGD
jgi:hypothetical protein